MSPLRAFGCSLMLAVLLGVSGSLRAVAREPLHLAIAPYVSPVRAIKHHRVLIEFLQQRLERRVIVTSATSFSEYLRRIATDPSYEVLFLPPHLALRDEAKRYSVLAVTRLRIVGLILVRKASSNGVGALTDLRGKSIAVSDAHALLFHQFKRFARIHGIDPDQMTFEFAENHENAAMRVVHGDADAAVVGSGVFSSLPADIRERLTVVAQMPALSGMALAIRSSIPEAELAKLRSALTDFNETPMARQYLFQGFDEIDAERLRELLNFTP